MAQDQSGKKSPSRLSDALNAASRELGEAAPQPPAAETPENSPPGLGGLPKFKATTAGKTPPPLPSAADPKPADAKPADPTLATEPTDGPAPVAETSPPEGKPADASSPDAKHVDLGRPPADAVTGAPADKIAELTRTPPPSSKAAPPPGPTSAKREATLGLPAPAAGLSAPPKSQSGASTGPRPTDATGSPREPVGKDPRRAARRRPAGGTVAANDDLPSIGGLIYALDQRPTKRPYIVAASMSGAWLAIGGFFAWGMLAPEIAQSATFADLLARPVILTTLATVVLPICVFWFLAWLLYQAQDLRLRSTAMTEVAIRLAEPDRSAEQSVASLGQSVRKQVNFMNEAIARAITRAGELEGMVHNEVAQLDNAYKLNEVRIHGLMKDIARERESLATTSTDMHTTLSAVGNEVPALIEKLNAQQIKLAKIIEGAGQNLISLETSLLKASGQLETSLGERTTHLESVMGTSTGQMQNLLVDRTNHLQTVLDEYTGALNTALGNRAGQIHTVLDEYSGAVSSALSNRTEHLQSVFENYTRALDATLAARAQQLDTQVVERTQALDDAFTRKLEVLDDFMRQSAQLIDGTVGDRARMLTTAMETHARQLADTLGRQAGNLDETLMHGINAVRRTSENITRQSVKAIEGLAGQADLLKNVSENLLGQIGTVTTRFENQGQSIMRAANALESANFRIDQTLQGRQRELVETLGRLTGTSEQVGQQLLTYRTNLDNSINDAHTRTRQFTEEMTRGAQSHAETALAELERLKNETAAHASRAVDDMRTHMSSVSHEVSQQVGSLSSRLAETTDDLRTRAERAAADFTRDQERLRADAARIPDAARDSAEAMRRAISEQMRALDQLSTIAGRETQGRAITPPAPLHPEPAPRPSPSLAAAIAAQTAPQPPAQHRPPARNAAPAAPPAGAGASAWSLGELLARASTDERRAAATPEPGAAPGAPINLESIARALDPATATAIWSRFRAGQRGIMVRSIYSAEGRSIFDEVCRRYQAEAEFRGMVDRFLTDFELMLRDTEQRDPSGRQVESHLQSGSGRVYLFLAHASNRLV